jgi:glycogen operon protein
MGTDIHGERLVDDSFYILFNAHHEPVEFTLPAGEPFARRWAKLIDSTAPAPDKRSPPEFAEGEKLSVAGRSLMLLRSLPSEP